MDNLILSLNKLNRRDFLSINRFKASLCPLSSCAQLSLLALDMMVWWRVLVGFRCAYSFGRDNCVRQSRQSSRIMGCEEQSEPLGFVMLNFLPGWGVSLLSLTKDPTYLLWVQSMSSGKGLYLRTLRKLAGASKVRGYYSKELPTSIKVES